MCPPPTISGHIWRAPLVNIPGLQQWVAEAKLARTSAKRVFNRNVKKIIDSINSKDTAALIESRFKDLKRLWDDVQRKHERYIESLENSKTTYDVEQEDGWIDQMDKVYDDVLRQNLAYFKIVE